MCSLTTDYLCSTKEFIFKIIFMYVHIYLCYFHVCTQGGKMLDPLEPELQVVVSHPTCVLGIEPRVLSKREKLF